MVVMVVIEWPTLYKVKVFDFISNQSTWITPRFSSFSSMISYDLISSIFNAVISFSTLLRNRLNCQQNNFFPKILSIFYFSHFLYFKKNNSRFLLNLMNALILYFCECWNNSLSNSRLPPITISHWIRLEHTHRKNDDSVLIQDFRRQKTIFEKCLIV